MGFLNSNKTPEPDPVVTAAQSRAEARAVAQEQRESTAASARLRRVRTGGMKLLFSPARDPGTGMPVNQLAGQTQLQTKLGSSS